jgi:hypothetical protein
MSAPSSSPCKDPPSGGAERPKPPSNADLRAMMRFQEVSSEMLIREDRDARG